MTEPKQLPQQRINIELPNDLNATYANFAVITHSSNEVIIDFAQILPGLPKARVQVRVLLTPLNAKMLYQALGQNLAKYEGQFGPIAGAGQPSRPFDSRPGTLGGMQWTVGGDDASPNSPPEA